MTSERGSEADRSVRGSKIRVKSASHQIRLSLSYNGCRSWPATEYLFGFTSGVFASANQWAAVPRLWQGRQVSLRQTSKVRGPPGSGEHQLQEGGRLRSVVGSSAQHDCV
jgi:hypothetical protein